MNKRSVGKFNKRIHKKCETKEAQDLQPVCGGKKRSKKDDKYNNNQILCSIGPILFKTWKVKLSECACLLVFKPKTYKYIFNYLSALLCDPLKHSEKKGDDSDREEKKEDIKKDI